MRGEVGGIKKKNTKRGLISEMSEGRRKRMRVE